MFTEALNLLGIGGAPSPTSTPAPVVEAVGQTPQEAIVAGGGQASEANTVSPEGEVSKTMKRMGNVVESMGKELLAESSQQVRQAPAFKPSFRPIQTPAFGSDVLGQIAGDNYNLQM